MFDPNEHLMDLKGKKYLQVMWRLVWFREENPLWNIDTKLEQLTENHALFSAKIYDENGVQKASGYGSESIKDFRDYIEKAETKSIGRALAMLGYGTQFAPELDEGERIVDSPATLKGKKQEQEKLEAQEPPTVICERCAKAIKPTRSNGKIYDVEEIMKISEKTYSHVYCWECMRAVRQEMKTNEN